MRIPRLTTLTLTFALSLSACKKQPETPKEAWAQLRDDGASSADSEVVADWLLSELIKPGGTAVQAKKARQRLDTFKEPTMLGELGRGLYDVGHGHIAAAGDAFFRSLVLARESEDPRAELVAWYASIFSLELAEQVPDFGKKHKQEMELLLREPGKVGFRTYAGVVDLWAKEELNTTRSDVEEKVAKKLGCVADIRLAGPFGKGRASDHLLAFAAEEPGPWPFAFPAEEHGVTPRQVKTERFGCDVESTESLPGGIYYGETYVELAQAEELIVTAAGATKLWVDDHLVLERDVRQWGVWPRFGARVRLSPGRHRILWKVGDASSALRLVRSDGRPFPVKTSVDPSGGYVLSAPEVLADPNVVMAYISSDGVVDPKDDLTRFIVAFLANHEGQPDVATVMFEPFVKDPGQATGSTLAMAASFVAGDPIYDESQTRELIHELEVRAHEHDAGLWYPRLRMALWDAAQRGLTEAVEPLEQLVREFPEVTTLYNSLARTYEELAWGPELERTVALVTKKFPEDPGAISLGIDLAEEQGKPKEVDVLLTKLRELDPDNEVFVQRALARHDYKEALAELKRLAARRPSRKDLLERIEDVMVRSGDTSRVLARLEEAVEREPRDVHSRLALADFELAQGKNGALARQLVQAVEAGADPSVIEEAIDLIEGVTELEPYRLDAISVIKEYEQAGKEHPGTAVRVLDYGAVLVRSDGSSRFLEHELVRVQSEEGIKQFTELDTQGSTLHLRVIKKDGRILEPELVSGKETVTMPHLEIGDYVEQERILSRWGDGVGENYVGPTWFFKEQNVAYARSEFAIISPIEKKLQIETENDVPEPVVETRGTRILHRFRMDDSPAAPAEPSSPPAREFMPRLSVGWGLSFEDRLRETSRGLVSLTPVDPRITRIAEKIVQGKNSDPVTRARALYHWVLDSVQEGEETDGRRVVVSGSGNRWRAFVTLCESIKVPVHWGLAESRLSSPIVGEVSSSQRPLMPVLFVGEGKDAVWLTIADKFAPFGTVPGPLRGEAAYLMGGQEAVKTTVPTGGQADGISYEGKGQLRADGSAQLSLRIVFHGQFAANLRNGLSQIPEGQLAGIIESRLLGQELKGARLLSHQVLDAEKLDRPLIIAAEVEAPQLATASGGGLLLGPPFMPRLGGLTPLAQRVTPLLITDSTAQGLDLQLALPPGMQASAVRSHAEHPRSRFEIQDSTLPSVLHLVRELHTDAGRVAPADYPAFQSYTRQADAALSTAIRIGKP